MIAAPDFISRNNRSCKSPWNSVKHNGLDTSVKVHFSNAVHNTMMAINLARAVAKR